MAASDMVLTANYDRQSCHHPYLHHSASAAVSADEMSLSPRPGHHILHQDQSQYSMQSRAPSTGDLMFPVSAASVVQSSPVPCPQRHFSTISAAHQVSSVQPGCQQAAYNYRPSPTAAPLSDSASSTSSSSEMSHGCRFYPPAIQELSVFQPIAPYSIRGETSSDGRFIAERSPLSCEVSRQSSTACEGSYNLDHAVKYETFYPGAVYEGSSPQSSGGYAGTASGRAEKQACSEAASGSECSGSRQTTTAPSSPVIKTYKWMTVKRGPPRTTTGC